MTHKASAIFLAMGLAFGTGSASAALPASAAIPAGKIQLSDNSAEYLIDRIGVDTSGASCVVGTAGCFANGKVDVGDSLRGIMTINSVEGLVPPSPAVGIGTGTAYNELTAVFQGLVVGKVATANTDPFGNTAYNYAFSPDPLSGLGAGVMAVVYDDPAQDFARVGCANFAACEATATNGNVWATVGFTNPSNFWVSLNSAEDPSIGAILPTTTPFGSFFMGVNIITNNTGYLWNQVNCLNPGIGIVSVDVCGQGGMLASGRILDGTNTPYDIFDNVDFTMNRVPEPASAALLGLGLLGMGVGRLRRASK